MSISLETHRFKLFRFQPQAINSLCCELNNPDRIAVYKQDKKYGVIEIWLVEPWYCIQEFFVEPGSIEALCWCSERLFSAGASGDLVEYNLNSCSPKKAVSANAGCIWCLAVSPSADLIAAGTEDGCVVLFSVILGQDADYLRSFMRQEGRILSIVFHPSCEQIISAGFDSLCVWDVDEGRVLERIMIPRVEASTPTIVWSLAVLPDSTIVSGDSRGMTSFWDGQKANLISEFHCHKADVLAVCVDKFGNVFSAGIDPVVVQFRRTHPGRDLSLTNWSRASILHGHTHDVRALLTNNTFLMSAGVDCQIHIRKYLVDSTSTELGHVMLDARKVSSIPQRRLVSFAQKAEQVLLNYTTRLELWKCGVPSRPPTEPDSLCALSEFPKKLVDMTTKGPVVCFDINTDATLVAYSTHWRLRLFSVSQSEILSNITVKRISLPDDTPAAQRLCFCDSSSLLFTSSDLSLFRLEVDDDKNASFSETTIKLEGLTSPVNLLTCSADGRYAAISDISCNIVITDLEQKCVLYNLPRHKHMTSAMCFNPHDNSKLFLVSTENKMRMYDVVRKSFTEWSAKSIHWKHPDWSHRLHVVTHVAFHPTMPSLILLQDCIMICIVDLNKELPAKSVALFKRLKRIPRDKIQSSEHAIHTCEKFRYILGAELFGDGKLFVAERTPVEIVENFPDPLKKKKFAIE